MARTEGEEEPRHHAVARPAAATVHRGGSSAVSWIWVPLETGAAPLLILEDFKSSAVQNSDILIDLLTAANSQLVYTSYLLVITH